MSISIPQVQIQPVDISADRLPSSPPPRAPTGGGSVSFGGRQTSITSSGASFTSRFSAPQLTLPALGTPSTGVYKTAPAVPAKTGQSRPAAPSSEKYFAFLGNVVADVSKPTIEIPARAQLLDIEIPEYTFPTISLADLDIPAFTPYAPTPLADIGPYTPKTEISSLVLSVLEGKEVIDAVAQDAMLDTALKYVDRKELFGIQKIMTESAARGFSMPTGAVNAQVAELLHELVVEKNEVAEKVRDEAYELAAAAVQQAASAAIQTGAANLRFAVSYARKQVELYKFDIQVASTYLEELTRAYNLQAQAANEIISAYRAYIDAVLKQDDVTVAQVAAARAQLRSQKADVEMYATQLDVLKNFYSVEGLGVEAQALKLREFEIASQVAKNNAEIAQINVGQYAESIKAMSQEVDAEITRLGTFDSIAQVYLEQANTFDANIQGQTAASRANVAASQAVIRQIDSAVDLLRADIQSYRDYAGAQQSYNRAVAESVSSYRDQVNSYLRVVDAARDRANAVARYEADYAEAQNSFNLAKSDLEARRSLLKAQQAAEQIVLDSSADAANATIQAGAVQSLYAKISSNFRVSDSASFRDRAQYGNQFSTRDSSFRSWEAVKIYPTAAA